MTEIIERELATEYDSQVLKWEMLKMEVRRFSMYYSAEKKKAKQLELLALEKRQVELESQLDAEVINSDQEKHILLAKIKADIETIQEERTKACILRSKATWIDSAEKNSAYFFGLEKRNYNRKCISKIVSEKGEVITDFKSILQEQKRFYETLYQERNLDENGEHITHLNYLKDIDNRYITKVRQCDRQKLEENITIHELYDAIMSLQAGKTSGSDGYTQEFYRKFWHKIKFLLFDVYKTAIKEESLHNSARHSIIMLLDKPQKDLLKLQNWRPLSMLTTDYKIFAKMIANRLSIVLPYIIADYQSGFIKGRYIAQNITELLSIIEYCHQTKEDIMLISYDIWKAFDSVKWSSLQEVLKCFNFGPFFCLLVRIIQTNIISVVSNNNHWSNQFKISKGLRQGCPASPALYVIMNQIVSSKIMQNEKIKGVIINGVEKKIALYVDDLWTPLLYEKESLLAMLHELKLFEQFSGLRLNYEKTKILRLGSIHGSEAKISTIEPLIWTNEPIEILGFDICASVTQTLTKSLAKSVKKLQTVLDTWKSRSITPMGRIILFNTLGVSLFIYKLMALPCPPKNIFCRN